MTLAAAGITAEVIRDVMPPRARDASAAWRQACIARVMQEISTLMPANAAQARFAARILILRGLADTLTLRAYAAELTDLWL